MSQEVLPPPNIKAVSEFELAAIEEKIGNLAESYDFEGLARLTEDYPLPAETLDDYKRTEGMEFLLRNKVNLINAVNKFGEQWLEY